MANPSGSLLERIYSDSTARPWYIYHTLYRDRRLCDLTPSERAAIPIKGIGQEKVFSQKRGSYKEAFKGIDPETRNTFSPIDKVDILERICNDPAAWDKWERCAELYTDSRLATMAGSLELDVDYRTLKEIWDSEPGEWKPVSDLDHELDAARAALFGSHTVPGEPIARFTHIDEQTINQQKLTNKPLKNIVMEEQSKEQINLNIEAEDGQVEIVHRYGEAAEILDPIRVHINGTIDAPSEYFQQRVEEGEIDTSKAHLEVWQNKGVISLKCDPASQIGGEVNGEITMNKLLKKMRINDYGGSKRGEDDFILLLKETRSLFARQRESMDLVDKINNLEIEVNKKIDRTDDERGGRKDFYEQTCEDKLPEGFDLSTNIFVGAPDETVEHTFHVEIKYHYKSQLYFWLESPGMQEIVDEVMKNTLGEEIEKFEGKIPIIYK